MSRIESIYKQGIDRLNFYNRTEWRMPKHERKYKSHHNGHHVSDAKKNGSDRGGVSCYYPEDYAGAGSCTAKIFADGCVN